MGKPIVTAIEEGAPGDDAVEEKLKNPAEVEKTIQESGEKQVIESAKTCFELGEDCNIAKDLNPQLVPVVFKQPLKKRPRVKKCVWVKFSTEELVKSWKIKNQQKRTKKKLYVNVVPKLLN